MNPSAHTTAVQLILTEQLLPALRRTVAELGNDDPNTLVHTRPTGIASSYPTNSAAGIVRHLCGVLDSWGAACLGGREIERDREAEFRYAGPVVSQLDRLDDLVAQLPQWTVAADERGALCHATGTGFDVDSARAAGTLTPQWVLAHILHDVAGHLGHLEVTRDILLTEVGPGPR